MSSRSGARRSPSTPIAARNGTHCRTIASMSLRSARRCWTGITACGKAYLAYWAYPVKTSFPSFASFLCLHDIGKFAKKFQAKVPALYPVCLGDDPASVPDRYDHGAGGLRLFDADDGLFHLPGGPSRRVWRLLVSAVVGHHGAPPQPVIGESRVALRPDFGKAGIEAADMFVQQTRDLFALPQALPPLERERVRRASFALAGLAVLADWIGSKQEWFPYVFPAQAGMKCYGHLNVYGRFHFDVEEAQRRKGLRPLRGAGGRIP